jgi:hypothetical protein
MRWRGIIIESLEALGGSAHLDDIEEYIKNNSDEDFKKSHIIQGNTIRAELQFASSDARQFKKKHDLFYSVEGIKKRSGIWGLRSKIVNTPRAEDLGEIEEKTDLPERVITEIYRVLRDTVLTKKIKILYQNECQICNQKIKLQENDYSEAHHIKPLGRHRGPDSADNIIILCPNHHVEFDYGVIAINPNTLEIIHKDDKNIFINKNIKLHPSHRLNKEYLEYHLNNIYNNEKK